MTTQPPIFWASPQIGVTVAVAAVLHFLFLPPLEVDGRTARLRDRPNARGGIVDRIMDLRHGKRCNARIGVWQSHGEYPFVRRAADRNRHRVA